MLWFLSLSLLLILYFFCIHQLKKILFVCNNLSKFPSPIFQQLNWTAFHSILFHPTSLDAFFFSFLLPSRATLPTIIIWLRKNFLTKTKLWVVDGFRIIEVFQIFVDQLRWTKWLKEEETSAQLNEEKFTPSFGDF